MNNKDMKKKFFITIKFFLFLLTVCDSSIIIKLSDINNNIAVNIPNDLCNGTKYTTIEPTTMEITTIEPTTIETTTTEPTTIETTTIETTTIETTTMEPTTIETTTIETTTMEPTTTEPTTMEPTTIETTTIETTTIEPTTTETITTEPTTMEPTTTETITTTEKFPYGTIKYLVYGDSGVLYIEYKKIGSAWNRTQSINSGSTRNIKDMVIFKERLVSNLDVGSYIEIHRNDTSSVILTNVTYTTKIMEVCSDRILQITTDDKVIYSNDSINYNLVTSNFEGTLNNIACNPITGVIIISGINVYRSTDNGTTFTLVTTTNNTNTIKYLKDKFYALENNMTSIVGREYNRIVTSSDDGLSWDYSYSHEYITNRPLIDIEYGNKHDKLVMVTNEDDLSRSRIYHMSLNFVSINEFIPSTYINRISIINEEPNNVIIYTYPTVTNYMSNNGFSIFDYVVASNRVSPIGYNGAITLDF